MKDTTESFDQLIKSKLDEVKVDPSLADAYWQQIQLPVIKQAGTSNFRRYYWLGASLILATLAILLVTKSDKNSKEDADATAKIIQQPRKVIPVSTYNTVKITDKQQVDVSPSITEPHVIKESSLNKSGPGKSAFANNQLQDKLTYDSISNHQATITLNSISQVKEVDTANEANLLRTTIQQADINLKKADSLSKKPEVKTKAPYIIW